MISLAAALLPYILAAVVIVAVYALVLGLCRSAGREYPEMDALEAANAVASAPERAKAGGE